jgi:diguanylate cyclase (GGDEF)-like protein
MYVYIYRLAVNDSKNIYVCLKIVLVEEMDGPRLLVGLIDVDDQKRKEIQYEESITVAEKKANIDELTGVKNRKAYSEAEEKLNEEIKANKAKKYAIVVCDMNGLKEVNDTMGHLAGDKYIKEGCQIICNTFSHSPVFRVGGDEFAVIVQGKDLANLDYLLSVIDDTNEENKAEGRVTMAAGAAYGQEGKLVGEIFEMADANMYIKKKRMKNAY